MSIKYLTIHCAATIEGRDHTADEVARWDIARFKQESYHHIVTLDGTDHVRLADNVKGAHTGGHNTGNIGVCYVGGLGLDGKPKDTRTAAQRLTLRRIVATYQAKYPGIIVLGHRDWSPDLNKNGKIDSYEWLKACPCFDVRTQL